MLLIFFNILLYSQTCFNIIKYIFIVSLVFSNLIVFYYIICNFIPNKSTYSKKKLAPIFGLLIGKDKSANKIYLPEKSLYQNILVTGSIGSGKTASAIYPFAKQLIEYKDFYLIEYGDSVGLAHKSDIKKYQGTFVVVDLGDQRVYMYCNTDMVFEDVCTTGKNSTPTRTGAFRVSEVSDHRYFSEDAQATVLWARFDGGNGLHDAEGWEALKNFGSNSYRKYSGSKGCVRLPYAVARFLAKYVRVGTKVLVKD